MYNYQEEKAKLMSVEGINAVVSAKEAAARLFKEAGAARWDKLTDGFMADTFFKCAVVDFLVESRMIKPINAGQVMTQYTVYVPGERGL